MYKKKIKAEDFDEIKTKSMEDKKIWRHTFLIMQHTVYK